MANLLHRWLTDPANTGGAFPDGSMHLKAFRLEPFEPWGVDATVLNILRNPTQYKIERIEGILAQFPGRQFVLVGDSGEKDPEIYSEVSRRNPSRIRCMYIRSLVHKPLDDARHAHVSRGLDGALLVPFTDPFSPPSLQDILNKGTC